MRSPHIEKIDLFAESSLRFEFLVGESHRTKYKKILVARFWGEYRVGSAGNPDAAFIRAFAQAAISYCEPDGMLLDISEVRYEWGDMLDSVFSLGRRYYLHEAPGDFSPIEKPLFKEEELPQATLIGPPCIQAIRTLLLGKHCLPDASLDEFPWLFEDFEKAWYYLEDQIALGR